MSFFSDVSGAFEHHVLKKVGESGKPGPFIGRAHVVPDINRDQGQAVVFRQNQIEAVRQPILLENGTDDDSLLLIKDIGGI